MVLQECITLFNFLVYAIDLTLNNERVRNFKITNDEKHFNEETQNNVYIYNGYFYDGNERENQYKEAIERYKNINFGKLQQELFYINFDVEDITDTDFKKVVMTIENYYKKISERHRTDFKNMTYVFHFNQDIPHVHIICETVKR